MDYEKIMDVLKTIKNICKNSICCENCIFYKYDKLLNTKCGLENVPKDWKIKKSQKILLVVKVFK